MENCGLYPLLKKSCQQISMQFCEELGWQEGCGQVLLVIGFFCGFWIISQDTITRVQRWQLYLVS